MFSTPVFAKTTVEIVSRYDSHITSALVASEMVSILNKSQEKYEFRITPLPGASGEVADQRAMTLARSGQLVLVLGSSSTYGYNRFLFPNSFDRDKDLIPLIGMTGTPIAIQVNPKSNYNSVQDLVAHLKSKNEAFHAGTVSNSNTKFFDAIFRQNYDLTNVKQLSYRLSTDMMRSVLGNESDYAVYNYADNVGLKLLVVSTDERVPKFPDVPTGKEIGFPDFRFNTLNMISVPKENLEFGVSLVILLKKICLSEEMKAFVDKTPSIRYCYSAEEIKEKISQEMILLKKYQHLLEIKP